MGRYLLLVLATGVLVGCAQAEPPQVERFRLENGLTVLLRPVEGAEQIALVVLYSIGGHQDPEGKSGLAHLVEHCYVTAAAGETPARDMRAYVARYPDGWNAQTGDDYTVVACVFKPEALAGELRDAAARMRDLGVTQADLERETPRIATELDNMYGRIPVLGARNLARDKLCPGPHGGRKGGLAEQVKAVTLAAVQQRLTRYYKPKNAVLVVAGSFDAAAAREAVAKHFSPIPSGDMAPKLQDRPKPNLPIDEVLPVRPAQPGAGPVAAIAYAAPRPDSDLFAPFLVMVARLWQRAGSLGAGPGQVPVQYAPLDDPSVVCIMAPLAAGEKPEAAIARLEVFVADAAKADVAASDRMMALQYFALPFGLLDIPDPILAQNVYGVAFSVGRRAQMGLDPAAFKKVVDKVTTEDLRRAAHEVFSKKARAGIVVLPG